MVALGLIPMATPKRPSVGQPGASKGYRTLAFQPTTRRRNLRFSLRSIFVVTALVAVVCAAVAYRAKWRRVRIAQEDFLHTLNILEILEGEDFGFECMTISNGHVGGWGADCIESRAHYDVRTNGETLENVTDMLEKELLTWLASAKPTVSSSSHRQRHGGSITFYYRAAKGVITYNVTQDVSFEGYDALVSVNVDMFR